jgi:hypothetical protein
MIAKVHLGRSNEHVRLEFRDKESGTEFLEATFTLEDWARVLFAAGGDCEFELTAENVGKRHEMKTIKIAFHDYLFNGGNREDAAKKALEPYEIDGWKGDWRDLLNHHRRYLNSNSYNVTFHRYV